MADCCSGLLESYFDLPASTASNSSNVTASNIWASNVTTSNLLASNATIVSLNSTSIVSSTISTTSLSAGTVTSGTVSAGTVTGCNLTAFSNLTSSNIAALSNDLSSLSNNFVGLSNYVTSNLSSSYVTLPVYTAFSNLTTSNIASLSNRVTTLSNSLGTAAYCNVTAFMAASNFTYASASSSGFLTQTDWVRFNSNAGYSPCNLFASLYASNAFMSNVQFGTGVSTFSNPAYFGGSKPSVTIFGNEPYMYIASGSNSPYGGPSIILDDSVAVGLSNDRRFQTLIFQGGSNFGIQGYSGAATGAGPNVISMCNLSCNVTVGNSNGNVIVPTALTVSGLVTSSTGGFRFPDGTTQTTASTTGCNMFASLYASNAFMSNVTVGSTAAPVLSFPAVNVTTCNYRGFQVVNRDATGLSPAEIVFDNTAVRSNNFGAVGVGSNRGLFMYMTKPGDVLNISSNGSVYVGRAGSIGSGSNYDDTFGSLNLTSGGNNNGRGVITFGNSSTGTNNWHVVTGDNGGAYNWYNGNYGGTGGGSSLRMYLHNTGRLFLSGTASYIQFNDTGTSTTTNVGNGGGNFFVQVNSGSYPLVVNNASLLTQMVGVYNNTTTGTANVIVDSTGNVRRTTSSRRYKTNIRYDSNVNWKLLQLRPALFDAINGSASNSYGAIAEDVHDLGLSNLVVYNSNNQPDALAYDRFACAMLPMMSNLMTRIARLEDRLSRRES